MIESNEKIIKEKIVEIETRCLNEELEFIIQKTQVNREQAYNLLMKFRDIWEFTSNVSVSGDSLIITLPKKEARERGISKRTPVFLALKTLRFFKPKDSDKLI